MRLPVESPVAACDLRSRVDGLAAARAEEDRRVVDGCEVRDSRGELESRRVRVVAEHVVRRERTELRRHRVRDLGTAVADVREPQTGGRVQVLRPGDVPNRRSLAAGEYELVPLDLAHRGERMPEPLRCSAVGHPPTLSRPS